LSDLAYCFAEAFCNNGISLALVIDELLLLGGHQLRMLTSPAVV